MEHKPNPELLRFMLGGIDAEYEAEVKRAEKRRSERRAEARWWWVSAGGSGEDLPDFAVEADTAPAEQASTVEAPKKSALNGSSGRRKVPRVRGMAVKADIQRYVQDALANPDSDIVTQTTIKDRVLQEYPYSNVNSLRVAIAAQLNELAEQGELDLIERARAGAPNKYRKKTKHVEEPEESLLRSGP